jgi:hypothetical protein
MVDLSTHNPKIECSNPTTGSGKEKKWQKEAFKLFSWTWILTYKRSNLTKLPLGQYFQ